MRFARETTIRRIDEIPIEIKFLLLRQLCQFVIFFTNLD